MTPNSYRNFTCGKLHYPQFSFNLSEHRILGMETATQIAKSSFCYYRKPPNNSYSIFMNFYTNQSGLLLHFFDMISLKWFFCSLSCQVVNSLETSIQYYIKTQKACSDSFLRILFNCSALVLPHGSKDFSVSSNILSRRM